MSEIDVATVQGFFEHPAEAVWAWEIPVYLFLGGAAAGLLILASLLGLRRDAEQRPAPVRLLPLAAVALVGAGMGVLLLDLENKLNVLRFYLAFRPTSAMSWGAWILVLVVPAALALTLAELTDAELGSVARWPAARRLPLQRLAELARGRLDGLRRANLLLGVGLGVYTGILLSTLGPARPLWNSALLGPLFLASGLSAGAALVLLLPLPERQYQAVQRTDLVAMGLEAVLLALFLAGLATAGRPGAEAAGLLLGGPYTAPFWALVVVTGLAVPALLDLLERRRHLPRTLAAPLLVLAGGLALRFVLVAAGQAPG